MRTILYQITLLQPALVTAPGGDPNSDVALDYLPGSVLRGAIIAEYLLKFGGPPDLAGNKDMRNLFFDGTTCYLNGYPAERGMRTLPTPQSLKVMKGRKSPIYDFAVNDPDGEGKLQWQNIGRPFCLLDQPREPFIAESEADDSEEQREDAKARFYSTLRRLSVHTERDRIYGRARKDSGEVYRYSALAEGQKFMGVILFDDNRTPESSDEYEKEVEKIRSLLNGEMALGGSRSGGYGRASLEEVEVLDKWSEAPRSDQKVMTVTLLSDALLRDSSGQFVADSEALRMELENRMGCGLKKLRVFMRGRVVGGFNRKWGLPLPQALAIQMGSVFVFAKPDCSERRLRDLEMTGLGERRAEGFGRVAINWHTSEVLTLIENKPDGPLTAPPMKDDASKKIALQMSERMLRQQLNDAVREEANGISVKAPPENAQLSRMRAIIQNELLKEKPDPACVNRFLSEVKNRSTARKQFEKARVINLRLIDWLEQNAELKDKSSCASLLTAQQARARAIGSIKPRFEKALRDEYALRFIDAVLARAAKSNQEKD